MTPVEMQIPPVAIRIESDQTGLLLRMTNMTAQPLKGVTLLLRESPFWARVQPNRVFYPLIPAGASTAPQRLTLRQTGGDALAAAPPWARPVCPLQFELSLPSAGEPKITGALHISFV